MEFIAGGFFTKQCNQLLQANDKFYEGMKVHTKNARFSLEHRDHKANTQDNDRRGKLSRWKRCPGREI